MHLIIDPNPSPHGSKLPFSPAKYPAVWSRTTPQFGSSEDFFTFAPKRFWNTPYGETRTQGWNFTTLEATEFEGTNLSSPWVMKTTQPECYVSFCGKSCLLQRGAGGFRREDGGWLSRLTLRKRRDRESTSNRCGGSNVRSIVGQSRRPFACSLVASNAPTTTYGLICSNVFGPIPGTWIRSSARVKGPFRVRNSTIRFAVASPMPGSRASSGQSARLISTSNRAKYRGGVSIDTQSPRSTR